MSFLRALAALVLTIVLVPIVVAGSAPREIAGRAPSAPELVSRPSRRTPAPQSRVDSSPGHEDVVAVPTSGPRPLDAKPFSFEGRSPRSEELPSPARSFLVSVDLHSRTAPGPHGCRFRLRC